MVFPTSPLWPVVYRKWSMSCFTLAGFVLHRWAMPWATDNSHQNQVWDVTLACDDTGTFIPTWSWWHFGQFMTQNYVCCFKYSLNFQGHAQKFEPNIVWHANFIEFKYDRTNPQNECAFEKTNKPCFYLHFANSNLKVIFSHLNIKKKLFHTWNIHKINVFNKIFIQSWLSKKCPQVPANLIFL